MSMWLQQLLGRLPEANYPALRRRLAPDRPPLLSEPVASFRSVPERFIQDIWYSLLFDTGRLSTTRGQSVRILDTGRPNRDNGPDFRDARVVIGGVEWSGDIEIHLRSSDWTAHRHDHDPRYNAVVLHVVLYADIWTDRLRRADDSVLPELVLLPFIGKPIRQLFRLLQLRPPPGELACGAKLAEVPSELMSGWIEKLGYERIDERRRLLAQNIEAAGGIDDLLFQATFESLGYAKNGGQMLDLARRLQASTLRGLPLVDRQALLFGTAGMLTDSRVEGKTCALEPFAAALRERYFELSRDKLPRMRSVSWSYFRLRPANFPSLRIAQGAALFEDGALLGTGAMERICAALGTSKPLPALRVLMDSDPGAFWNDHVRLDRQTSKRQSRIGRDRKDRIIANAILPVALTHAELTGNHVLKRSAFGALSALRPERDELTRRFEDAGVVVDSLVQSQGLHQLYRTRCDRGGCMSCAVARHLLKVTAA